MSQGKKETQKNNHNEGMQFYNSGDVHIHNAVAGQQAQAIENSLPSADKKPATQKRVARSFFWTLVSIFVAVGVIAGIIGISAHFNLFSSPTFPSPPAPGKTVIAPTGTAFASSPQTSATSTPPETKMSTPSADSALAMEYYSQYMAQAPTLVDTPARVNGWFQGSPAYATCKDEGSQGYHAIANSDANSGACIAPTPDLTGNYALQTTLTVQTGAGAGLAFAFTPNPSIDTNYNGSFYYLGYCGNSDASCPIANVFLDHVQNGQRVQCMGPEPDSIYSSRTDACPYQSPFVNTGLNTSNVLTVIVHSGTIYTYINGKYIFSFTPHNPVSYPTTGEVGCISIAGGDITCQPIKIWTH